MQQETTISTKFKPIHESSIFEIAETMQIDSLNGARRVLLDENRDETLSVLLESADFLHHFKNALIHEIIEVVNTFDTSIETVYLYDPSGSPKEREIHYPTVSGVSIQLLAVAAAPSGALKKFAAALGRALKIILLELPWPPRSELSCLVDILIVTKSDVMDNGGYGLFLSPSSKCVKKVWESNRSYLRNEGVEGISKNRDGRFYQK